MKHATLFLGALLLLGAFGTNASAKDSKAGSAVVAQSVAEAKNAFRDKKQDNRVEGYWTEESWDAHIKQLRRNRSDIQ